MAVLANEGARIVEEGVAESDAAVDVVQMHGYGFPRWRGGPMHYANEMGWEDTAQIMQKVAAESPNSWILSKRLAEYL
jgi:3-hydroxyacyl-CoA dehydrogenase